MLNRRRPETGGFLLLLCLWLFARVQAASPPASPASVSPPLAVSIAVPEQDGLRRLTLSNKSPRFFVVLRNISDHPVSIYKEDSSWGFYNLTLEVTAVGDKPLDKPLVVTRLWGIGNWFANRAQAIILQPGDEVVREVRVRGDKPGLPTSQDGAYAPFPLPRPTDRQVVRMRAVFSEKEDEDTARVHVWSGQAASEARDYEVLLSVP